MRPPDVYKSGCCQSFVVLIPCGLSGSELPAFPLLTLSGSGIATMQVGQRAPEPDRLGTVTLQVSKDKQVFGNYLPVHTCSGLDVLAKYMDASKINDMYASCFKEKSLYFQEGFCIFALFLISSLIEGRFSYLVLLSI